MPISKLWLCQNCETLQPLTQLTCEVCGESIPVEFRKPVISEFKASAKQARENDRLVFSWKTDFAKYVFLNGIRVSANGTKEIPATEKVTLKVSNGNGSIEKSMNIKVTHALELNDFTVNENNNEFGKDCVVTCNGRNIKKCLMSILSLFVIVVAFITWAYFFRHDIYNEIIYAINNNISNFLNSIKK